MWYGWSYVEGVPGMVEAQRLGKSQGVQEDSLVTVVLEGSGSFPNRQEDRSPGERNNGIRKSNPEVENFGFSHTSYLSAM